MINKIRSTTNMNKSPLHPCNIWVRTSTAALSAERYPLSTQREATDNWRAFLLAALNEDSASILKRRSCSVIPRPFMLRKMSLTSLLESGNLEGLASFCEEAELMVSFK